MQARPTHHLSDSPQAHQVERLPVFSCRRSDTRPDQLHLVRAVHDLARDHLAVVVPSGRPLADTLAQMDAQDNRLVCLWRQTPTDDQRRAIANAWHALTLAGPDSVDHLIQEAPAVGDLDAALGGGPK